LPQDSGTSWLVSNNIAPLLAAPFVQVEITDQAGEKSSISGLFVDIELIAEVPGMVALELKLIPMPKPVRQPLTQNFAQPKSRTFLPEIVGLIP